MSRSRTAPETFQVTAELRAWAAQNAPDVDLERATDMFRDHEFATPKSNWPGTWRNWMRRAQDHCGPYKHGARAAVKPVNDRHERERARTADMLRELHVEHEPESDEKRAERRAALQLALRGGLKVVK